MAQALRPRPVHIEFSRLSNVGALIDGVQLEQVIREWEQRNKVPWIHLQYCDTILGKVVSASESVDVPGYMICGSILIGAETVLQCMRDLALCISRDLQIKTVHLLYGEVIEEAHANDEEYRSELQPNVLFKFADPSSASANIQALNSEPSSNGRLN